MPANTVPTKLKLLRGTDQPCRMNDMEPEPSLEITKPKLSKKASKKWDEIVKVLQDCKVMTTADQDVLAKYCEAWVMWRFCTDEVVREPVIIDDKGCPTLNPYHKIQNQYFVQMLAGARELGLTPASRTKVKTTEKKKSDSGFSGI